jgi:hypothetical protein
VTKVYLVVDDIEHDNHEIYGVFSTKEKAEEYAKTQNGSYFMGVSIVEVELDKPM